MGVRPPSNDVDDEPDVVEFGIAALDARLADADVDYPVSKTELEDLFGDTTVPYDAAGHEMPISEGLAETSRQTFESKAELLNTLHPVFEQKRQSTSTGLLAQLRALVPF
jgi:hypothetical protein